MLRDYILRVLTTRIFFFFVFLLNLHKMMNVSRTYCDNNLTIYVNATIMLCALKYVVIYINCFSIKLEKK